MGELEKRKSEADDTPFDASPAALHFRLKGLEQKMDDLPDYLVLKLREIFPAKTECDKRHPPPKPDDPLPWGKILAGFLVALTTALGAWFGVNPSKPAAGQETAQGK